MTAEGGHRVVSAYQAADRAREHLSRLMSTTGVRAVSVDPAEDGWVVEVEVVEQPRIPADLLALYEVELDWDGELVAYRRTGQYARGGADDGDR